MVQITLFVRQDSQQTLFNFQQRLAELLLTLPAHNLGFIRWLKPHRNQLEITILVFLKTTLRPNTMLILVQLMLM